MALTILLARQDADAGCPGVALTLQQQQGQLSSACSSFLSVDFWAGEPRLARTQLPEVHATTAHLRPGF